MYVIIEQLQFLTFLELFDLPVGIGSGKVSEKQKLNSQNNHVFYVKTNFADMKTVLNSFNCSCFVSFCFYKSQVSRHNYVNTKWHNS